MEGSRSIPAAIMAIGAVAVGITLNAADFGDIAGAPKTFLVAVIAGFAATLAGRAARWRLKGE